ncbi:MAG: hypothetical protein V4568_15465 [Pseudomonadota bacterium]
MIKNLIITLKIYRDKLPLFLLLMIAPLALALFWTPWWVAVICLLIAPIAGALLISQTHPQPLTLRGSADSQDVTNAQLRKMRKMSNNIQHQLYHWSEISTNSYASVEQVASYVDEVIAHSETAVVQISNNFIDVTRKTRKQMEYALSLLERIRGASEYNQEITTVLTQIGELGNEIQTDINNIIVALQFQDMTQQKLQQLKSPLLTDLTSSLQTIFDETRVMSFKLEGSGLVDGQPTRNTAIQINRAKDQISIVNAAPVKTNPPVISAANIAQSGKDSSGGASVEIF